MLHAIHYALNLCRIWFHIETHAIDNYLKEMKKIQSIEFSSSIQIVNALTHMTRFWQWATRYQYYVHEKNKNFLILYGL